MNTESAINQTRLKNVSLVRTGDRSVEISWNFNNKFQEVAIFAGQTPDHIDRQNPVSISRAIATAKISGLDPEVRHYFEVAPNNDLKITISDRRVPLEGSVTITVAGTVHRPAVGEEVFIPANASHDVVTGIDGGSRWAYGYRQRMR